MVLAALALLGPRLGATESDPAFEQPHAIELSRAVPEAMQSGPGFVLGDSVFANGFSQDFVIATDEFGEFTPTSNYLLNVRVGEIRALQSLAEIRRSKAYVKAAAKAGVAPLYLLKDLATRPIDTVTGVPKGIWRAGKKAVKWIGGDRRPRADTEDGATREAIGVSRRKRALAASLQVDPFTTNLRLQDELDRVTWSSFAGGLSVTVAMAAVGVPPVAALTYRVSRMTLTTNQLVTSVSGGDLYRRNRKTLEEIGLGEEERLAFLDNPHLSPTTKTAITLALESMTGVSGFGHIVALGAEIQTEEDSVRLQRTTELMAAYHQNIAPVRAIVRWENHLFVIEQSGNTTAVIPADRLLWVPQTGNLADAMRVVSSAETKLSIWTTGVFSQTAQMALTQRGIALHDRIDL
jgi:hypothetical protein